MSGAALIYDPRYHTWDSWACLMCELYSTQNLAIPGPETEWRSWANGIKAIDIFTNEGAPDPSYFDDWKTWAESLVNAVNSTPSEN